VQFSGNATTPVFTPVNVSLKLAIAIGIGMLVGLEREWSQKELGTRTFAITAMIGTLSALAGAPFAYVGFAGILLIVLLAGLRTIKETKPVESTTFAALILTFVLGVLVGQGHHYTPVAASIVMTMLLSMKPALIQFAGGLQVNEVRSAVLLGLLAFVIFPILPQRPVDPWQLVNPREAWLTIILIAALGFGNYVLLKLYRSRGLYYTAVLGGMVNSTATIAELSGYLRHPSADIIGLAIVIDLLTVLAMFLRNLFILAIFAQSAVFTAAAPLAVMAVASGVVLWFQRRRGTAPIGELQLSSPLSFSKILKFGLIFLAIEIIGTLGQRFFGRFGFLLVSVIGGFVSSASTAAAAATLATHGQITAQAAGIATVLTSMASALSNLPMIHHQVKRNDLTRKLAMISLVIVVLGSITMIVVWRL
jgi:uncharacterized membrane protein (DUF4010 family)